MLAGLQINTLNICSEFMWREARWRGWDLLWFPGSHPTQGPLQKQKGQKVTDRDAFQAAVSFVLKRKRKRNPRHPVPVLHSAFSLGFVVELSKPDGFWGGSSDLLWFHFYEIYLKCRRELDSYKRRPCCLPLISVGRPAWTVFQVASLNLAPFANEQQKIWLMFMQSQHCSVIFNLFLFLLFECRRTT